MRQFSKHAVLFAASLFAIAAAAKDEPPPADPKAIEIIHELGLAESPTALRDMPGWRAPRRIVMATQNPNGTGTQEIRATLAGVAPGVEVVFVADATGLIKEAASADAIIGGDDVACDEGVLAAAKRLRWVAVMSAGVESCLGKPALERPGLTVTNMRAVAGPVMAEHTIALMFALSRSLQVSVGRQATGEGWNRNFAGSQPQALTGKTLLVAGLGGIGLEVAKRAHALGMKVIGTRNSSREGPDYVSRVGLSDELPAMIGEADVVVAALPLVPATTHLFDARMFARMKKTAYFISVGRGGSVVTDDLVAALNSGTIGGAGLDVTDPEPLPKNHPLWKARNIIITPHMSALSDLGQTARMLILKEQVRRFAAGDKLLSVVDFKKGY
ncbi:MAG TPA: D-2-hydroxyacid dehydrogenase [Steroidobacteraceae bacterium]|jgi:phosphoglycerate dehydrogenase-like enzyme|nr:D-2-hydroxyacid dehydrogenase [Steroidobacteraceae bacterium]